MQESLHNVSKADIMSIPFDGIIELPVEGACTSSARINSAQIRDLPSEEDLNKTTLRRKLADLFFMKAEGDFERLEITTYIKQDTARKWFNGKNRVSRRGLAKFVVGLKIDIDTADELFSLQGHPISLRNRFDYIVACSVKNGDGIEDFYDDVLKYCSIDIFGVEYTSAE